MSGVKGVPAKRVYPGEIGMYFEFFSKVDADRFYQQGIAKSSRIERIDLVAVVMKFSDAAESSES